ITTATPAPITITLNSVNGFGVGDIIQIDSEAFTVTAVNAGPKTLNVTRGTYNTTPATHLNKAPVLMVLSASAPPPPTVTLAKGVYIMAGGGFSVCGAGAVSAPQGVMIYNTNDPASSASTYGTLGPVNINTAGSVHLGPMNDGIYAGMTIFQDRSLTLNGGTCPGKAGTPADWDIALQSAAPLPVSGELGSISGTIYAPHLRSLFGDTMSGTATLAIITSCIYINGATSTFNFDANPGQLAGVTAGLGG
ncbi:MAG TPA: hypothetical protein VJ814_00815, partial [Gaiellaceae bacterium]|nr:hypothetical protein [Gaiellaceae bacterium]